MALPPTQLLGSSHEPLRSAASTQGEARQSDSKPVIVLVHGAFHSPEVWNKVKPRLQAAGYEVFTPRLLTAIRGEPVNYSWRADVAAIHDLVVPLFSQGRRAIIVAHSYGGVVATASVENQSIADRQSRGLRGGFSAVLYICASCIVQRGDSVTSVIGMPSSGLASIQQWLDMSTPLSLSVVPGLEPFYNDLPADEAREWCGKLLGLSKRALDEPLEFCTNEIKIPMTYLLCEEDKAVPIQAQEAMVAAIPAMRTRRCSAGHSPFLSQPDFTAEVIIEAAQEA